MSSTGFSNYYSGVSDLQRAQMASMVAGKMGNAYKLIIDDYANYKRQDGSSAYSGGDGNKYFGIGASFSAEYHFISIKQERLSNENVGSDFDNWWANLGTAGKLFIDWALGTGSDKRTFSNDRVANAMRNAKRVNEAREFYYKKYKNVEDIANTSVTGFKGSFGLSGLINAGLDPIEQYVGTYRINIYNFDGKTLWFAITNQTSMNSFLYDLGPSWDRSSWAPGGNMNQTYIWKEQVKR
ncbi:hypothetical protein [Solitalea canadensis]|uniref:Uncharacterized protein n=1 Tax=Solitalea canadensis (strain ATCC 29591 / DSM 3403 / JCM 21819 / LMG 8368 / NBRC 15130 / NCIMB 12057 / USAM 9D) TaxID=929556 RepID=H8KVS9_SOLCM|nr:hypothetical protein [Solitalea canadensis]AFD06702.1 hypothetical protein Solca_1635 [Solitalea canadensis DSM 3403]